MKKVSAKKKKVRRKWKKVVYKVPKKYEAKVKGFRLQGDIAKYIAKKDTKLLKKSKTKKSRGFGFDLRSYERDIDLLQ